jgi:hypothetical protein
LGIPGHCSHGTNNTSLWIGRSSVLNEFVLFPWFVIFGSPTASFTLRTKPSSSSSAFTTRANDQRFRGESLSLITTTSSTLKFLLGRTHFCRSCKACKNFPPPHPEFIAKVLQSFPVLTQVHIRHLKHSRRWKSYLTFRREEMIRRQGLWTVRRT